MSCILRKAFAGLVYLSASLLAEIERMKTTVSSTNLSTHSSVTNLNVKGTEGSIPSCTAIKQTRQLLWGASVAIRGDAQGYVRGERGGRHSLLIAG